MKTKLKLNKLLDAKASNSFVINNALFFQKLPFQGKLAINKQRKRTDNQSTNEDSIAQVSQENEQPKQALEVKEQVIKQLKNLDNQEVNKSDFQRIIEGVAHGLLLINHEGKVKFINSAGEKLFGRPKSELINHFLGLPIADENTEVTIFRPGGHIIMAEMQVSSITWESKTAYIASIRDVTV
ncbi:PAS domain-containing protein [Crocosphaera sp. XPORK-15E]|uniref:PAS domain-containing protein n=1 Tax=Crocosphaera sp. XPORK-15E TaxID=3110247 RepID=UPI002B20D55B|nr:PAS domain-containing protein [Crocosphaera sp. XPORK-15E]MEA5535714.1 PAS domain-containing protein [Crocosphaera sp. XPORK-15E]